MRNQVKKNYLALKAASLLLGMAIAIPAMAQDYPQKPVTMVIPFSPGGTNDTVGRFISEQLSKRWGKSVIVENRPGAGSSIGAAYVTQQAPDGYTLMVVSNSLTASAAINPHLPFDIEKDLQPLAIASIGDMFINTGPRTPAKTLIELQKNAQEQTLFFGTAGMGSIGHLSGYVLSEALDTRFEDVHYPGGNEAITDLAAGRVDVTFQGAQDSKKGLSTVVAVASPTRSADFPDVPTTAEAGFPDLIVNIWVGVFAPAGIDSDLANKINMDVRDIMKSPEAEVFLKAQSSLPSDLNVQGATDFVTKEAKLWQDVAERNGIKAK